MSNEITGQTSTFVPLDNLDRPGMCLPNRCAKPSTVLSDDVLTQLSRDGTQILAKTGDPRAGFRFDYKLGRSYGALTTSPLEKSTNPQLPEGTVAVVLDIALVEKWFPKEPGMITVKVTGRPEPSH